MQLVAEQMVRGGLPVDAATQEMDRRADGLLEKRRWMLAREGRARHEGRTRRLVLRRPALAVIASSSSCRWPPPSSSA